MTFDQKEDLRLRMIELEKKLAESEEERCKLEKTCNVLMRAFREEEKMHYKVLNKKYEKFLEDCTLRRRRNDIILKSLCRIEDRARALFAKTERLKILKDRYISYLKISEFKKDEPALAWTNFLYSPSQKITYDVRTKSVHWKSPYVSLGHKTKEFVEPEERFFSKYVSTSGDLHSKHKEDFFVSIPTPSRLMEYKKPEDDRRMYQEVWHQAPSEERINAFKNQEYSKQTLENHKLLQSQSYFENSKFNTENKHDSVNYTPATQSTYLKKEFCSEITDREISPVGVLNSERKEKISDDAASKIEKVAFTHQESIDKLKKALSVEEDEEIENDKKFKNIGETQKIIEKDEIEMNEKYLVQKYNLKTMNEDFNQPVISEPDTGPYNELKNDVIDHRSDNFDENVENKEPENLPIGLDGVDYQNETYPESYYEQPVHHNHTSIASDVILEEDESEQDVDENISHEGAKDPSSSSLENKNESDSSKDSSDEIDQPHPEKKLLSSSDKASNLHNEEEKFKSHEEQSGETEKAFDRDEQSKKSDSTVKSEKSIKRPPQSNLMYLLESDSGSFQIEHGDLATGNEDSDFDFSFN